MFVVALGLAMAAEPVEETVHKLDVTGVGEIYVPPDEAVVTLGVRAQGKMADEAFDLAAQAMNEVVTALGANVPAERIRTSRLSLEPRYDYETSGAPRLVGYEASATLEVRVDDPADAGAVIDAAVTAGANEITGINWVVEDEELVREEALTAAVADARAWADQVATDLGVRIVTPLTVRVRTQDTVPPPIMYDRAAEAMDAGAMPVLSGEQIYRAEVDVTFEIAPLDPDEIGSSDPEG